LSATTLNVSAFKNRPHLQYAGYVLLAAAVLTKGPLALVGSYGSRPSSVSCAHATFALSSCAIVDMTFTLFLFGGCALVIAGACA
jgi:hypothetical protein